MTDREFWQFVAILVIAVAIALGVIVSVADLELDRRRRRVRLEAQPGRHARREVPADRLLNDPTADSCRCAGCVSLWSEVAS